MKIHFPWWDFCFEWIIWKRRVYAFEWCIQKKNPISGSVFSSMVHFLMKMLWDIPWTKIHFPRWDFFSECIIQKRRVYAFEWCIQKKKSKVSSVIFCLWYIFWWRWHHQKFHNGRKYTSRDGIFFLNASFKRVYSTLSNDVFRKKIPSREVYFHLWCMSLRTLFLFFENGK